MEDFYKVLHDSVWECVSESTGGKELKAGRHLQRFMLFRTAEIECLVESCDKFNLKTEHMEKLSQN